jgi:hypothetical protein
MKKILALSFIIFGFLLNTSVVQGAGIGIAPQELRVTKSGAETIELFLSVHNTGDNTAFYSVYADTYEELIEIKSNTFQLTPGESTVVPVSVKNFPPGSYQTEISVVAQDAEGVEGAPKTGLKVPFTLEVEGEASSSTAILNKLIATILGLSLFLLLLSYLYSTRKSRLARFADGVTETVLYNQPRRLVKHYNKKHKLIVVSLLSVVLALGLLFWSLFTKTPGVIHAPAPQVSSFIEYSLDLIFPSGSESYVVSAKQATPFSLLEDLHEQGDIELEYNPPSEMGVFVTSISGMKNGSDGKYWVYEVDEVKVPLAADKRPLKLGENVVWKFVEPSPE